MAGQRSVALKEFDFAPGLFTGDTERGSKGRWVDGNNVRWYDGLPEKIGGFEHLNMLNEAGATVTYRGFARSRLRWESLDGQQWIAFGTNCKLYLFGLGVLWDITPLREQRTLTNPFTTSIGSAVVLVTDSGHGAIDGDSVRFSGASAVGGITINGEYVVANSTFDTYEITHSIAASSSATGGGTVTAQYDINCGLESDDFIAGYGTGTYGTGPYGEPQPGSTFQGFLRVWSLQQWGEDLLASPNGETLYWWDRDSGPQSRAVVRANAPFSMERMLVSPNDRHVVAFGANTITGQVDKMFVRWCKGEDFDVWEPLPENDAGGKRPDIGSRIIAALRTREMMFFWTDDAMYGMDFTAGEDIFSIRPLGEQVRIVSPGAAADVAGIIYFMADDDFYIYDGTLRILDCDMSTYIFGSHSFLGYNRQHHSKITCHVNSGFNEVVWNIPYGAATENTIQLCYNWVEKCWYKTDLATDVGDDRDLFYGLPYSLVDGNFYLQETGVDADESSLDAFLLSSEAEIVEDGEQLGLVNELIPDFDDIVGSVDVTLQGRNYPKSPTLTSAVMNVTPATTSIFPRFRARQTAIRIESNDLGDFWRMGKWRVRATPYGRRA